MGVKRFSIDSMKLHLQPAVGVAVALALTLIAVRLLLLPVVERIGMQRDAARQLRRSIEEAQMVSLELAARRDAFRRATDRMAEIESRIGKGQALARVLDTLRSQATRCHVMMSATQLAENQDQTLAPPIPLAAELRLQEVPVSVTLAGRYRQLGEFLAALTDAPFLSEVRSLTIKRKADRGSQLEAQMELVVYLAS
jgi:Tfp pilus assembly protein PilO